MFASSGSTRGIPSLGPRGEGWVAIQFILMAAIVGGGFLEPSWPAGVRDVLRGAGAVLVVAGFVLAVTAVRALGRSLTPLPLPSTRGGLVQAGPYRLVRHPMYGAGLLVFGGYSLLTGVPALVLTVALAAVWALKSRVEEGWLVTRYPEYAAFRARTPRRFLPFVW